MEEVHGWSSYGPMPTVYRDAPSAEEELRPELADLGRLARRGMRAVVKTARAEDRPRLSRILLEHLGSGAGEPGVDPGLDVDVVVRPPSLLDDVERAGPRAEVLEQDPRQPRPVLRAGGLDHGPHAPPRQSAEVGDLGTQIALVRHLDRTRCEAGPSAVRNPTTMSCHARPPARREGGQ